MSTGDEGAYIFVEPSGEPDDETPPPPADAAAEAPKRPVLESVDLTVAQRQTIEVLETPPPLCHPGPFSFSLLMVCLIVNSAAVHTHLFL